MDETGQVVEILKVMMHLQGEVIKIGFKILGPEGIDIAKKLTAVYHQASKNIKKLKGSEESVEYLLKTYGSNLEVLKVPEGEFEAYKEALMKWKIPFAEAPDLNLNDGMREFFFPTESADRVNEMIKKFMDAKMTGKKDGESLEPEEKASVISQEDYVNNADPAQMDQVVNEAKEDLAALGSLTEEEKQADFLKLRDLHTYTQYREDLHNPEKQLMSIPAEQVEFIDHEDQTILLHLPQSDDYLTVPFESTYVSEDNTSLLLFLNKEEEYEIAEAVTENGEVTQNVKSLSGVEIHKQFYDPETSGEYAEERIKIKKRAGMDEHIAKEAVEGTSESAEKVIENAGTAAVASETAEAAKKAAVSDMNDLSFMSEVVKDAAAAVPK